MKNKIKGLLALALAAFTSLTWADVTSSFGVNFTSGAGQNITEGAAGFAKGDYAQPTTWTNVSGGNGVAVVDNTMLVSWTSHGTWNSGVDTSTNDGKLLYNYLDDAVNGGRTKANVTITGLPADKQYAVALILSGDAENDGFNGKYSPALINGVTYSYVDGALVTGDAAVAATTWGNRRAANKNGPTTPTEGQNVMFVEGLSGSVLSITSAMDSWNVSRLTIAGVQVWITDTPASAATAPTDVEMISLNFHSAQTGGAVGEATASGLVSAQGWMDLTGANGTASTLKVWNGEKAADAAIGLSFKSKEFWGFNTVDAGYNYLRGYLDDGTHDGINGATIELTNIPFAQYSVIVYAATDTGNAYFHSVKINDKWYVGNATQTSIGYATECYDGAKARWGASQNATAVYGTNALRLDGLTSADLTIQAGAKSDNARGGIAAIQIVNTGAAVMSDVQQIEGAAEQKISELPEITKPVVELTLPAGATLIVDELPTTALTVISTGAVTIKVTDLSISQAQLDAMINTESVTGAVTSNLSETIGYTVGDVTYPLVYIGGTDGWSTAASWATGTRSDGEKIVWIPYTGTVVPGAPNSNTWNLGLIDGDLIGDAITADEDGYKVVNTPTLEGWAFKITVANGVHVKVPTLNKLQGECIIRVDDSSKITVANKGPGNNDVNNKYYIDAENGLVFENMPMPGGTAYLGATGSITTSTFANNQTIGGVTLDLGTPAEGRTVVTRTLYTYTAAPEFTINDGAVTTTDEEVEATEVLVLSNVGDYKFVKTDTAYQVQYVAYAETDELNAANVWNGAVDTAWETAGNWEAGVVPEANADVTITVAANTTLTIPAEGVTVGTLIVNGEGTLTLDGGKITAREIYANANIAASETTLALAPMNIAEGKTVTYTTTTTMADPDSMGNVNHALSLKAMTGAGTFVKKGAGVIGLFATAAEPAIVIEEGAIYVREAPTTVMNIAAKAGAEIRLAAWHVNFAKTANKITLDGGAQLTLANGANVSGTITIANAAETAAKICGSSFNDSTIAATITGAGKVEFADGGTFGEGKYPCDGATTYTGVISGELQVIISDTSAVTFTGANTYTGGTVIAEGVTVTVSNLTSIFGTGAITGAGTVKIAGGTYNGLSFAQYTDANTTIVIPADNTVTGYFNNATWTCAAKIQLDGALDMTNGFGAGKYTFTGPWAGAGAFSLSNNAPADVVRITGDISDFTGNISVAGARAITFCAATTGTNQKYSGKICVHGDYAYTAKVNGTWSAPVMVENGAKIGGTGTIDNTITFNNGAIIDTSVTATGNVTLNGTVTVSGEAGAIVLTCANAENLDLTKFAAPTGLRCIAEDGAVKLAVATVNVTIPAAPANTKWFMGETEVSGTIAVDPNTDVTLTLKAEEGYVFADGSTSKDYTVNFGETGATVETPNVTAATPVAQVGETKYQTLQDAFAAAKAGDTIILLADVTINSRLDIAQNVTIDLNGQTIDETVEDQFGAIYVKKGATLTIAATNGGEITTDGGIVIGNYGNVVVNGGTIAAGDDAEADVSIYNFYYQADWYGTTTINGGTVARIWNCGVATLAGGEVTDVDNSGAMEITDATVTNIILRDGTDALGIEGAGTLTAPEGLTVTTMDGQKVVYADGKYTVVEKSAIQLTIDLGDGVSSVAYKIGETTTTIDKDTTIDIAESGTVVSFTVTVNGNYFAPTVADVTVTQTRTVTIAGIAFSEVESADAAITDANRNVVYAWAKNKGKSQSEVSAANYLYADYLFNFEEFSAAEPTIEITEFTADPLVIKAKVTVNGETKIADLSATGLNLNGTLKYKAAATLEALEAATPKAALDATDRFFKVVVE